MDFIGGALPNVMFLIGVIAIGIGLGLEFKIIEVKNGLTRGSRIAACVVGAALVATSIALYLRPSQTAGTSAPAVAAQTQHTPVATQEPASAAVAIPSAVPSVEPTAVPTEIPTPAPTEVPSVIMPDIRGMSPKDAAKDLEEIGLQLGDPQESCAALGVREDLVVAAKKDRIACQSAEPGSNVPVGSSILYALTEKK